MRLFFERFFAVSLFLAIFSFAPAQAQVPPMRVVVFGDSLLSGVQLQKEQAYAARLERKMRELGYLDLIVEDMTYTGLSSAAALDRLPAVIDRKPDVVVVGFGLDDVERGVTIEQTYNNLIIIVGNLVQKGSYVVLAGLKAPPTLAPRYASQFDNIFPLVATARKGMLVNDMLAGIMGQARMTLADNIHPNSRGIDQMVENSYRQVDSLVRTKLHAAQYMQDYQNYQQNLGR
jgi:acyl-CoA thioesterase-1